MASDTAVTPGRPSFLLRFRAGPNVQTSFFRAWRVAFPAALVLAVLLATKEYVTSVVRGHAYPFSHSFRMTAPPALLWALLVPAVGRLGRRFPVFGGGAVRALAVHGGLSIAIVLGYTLLCIAVMYPLGWFPFLQPLPQTIRIGFVYLLPTTLLYYSLTLALYYAYAHYRALQAGEARARELEALLTRTQLEALRAKLHPHFLFNAMHTASALVSEDPEGAERVLAQLAALLRSAIDDPPGQLVPLEHELSIVEKYMAIQALRFSTRLSVNVDVDPDTRSSLVPPWLLQPLVENALVHGLMPRERGGSLNLTVRRDGEALVLCVQDDGVGAAGYDEAADNVGLGNTRQRLRHLYPGAHSVRIRTGPDEGFAVTIRIPLQTDRKTPQP